MCTGAQTAVIQKFGDQNNPAYGKGASYSKMDAERLFHRLLADRILTEEFIVTVSEHVASYLRPGPSVSSILNGTRQVCVMLSFSSQNCIDICFAYKLVNRATIRQCTVLFRQNNPHYNIAVDTATVPLNTHFASFRAHFEPLHNSLFSEKVRRP